MTCISGNGLKIIPVHLNSVFSGDFSFDSNLDLKLFESLANNLNTDEIFILDFENIKNTVVSDSIAMGAAGLLGKKVMLTNLKSSAYSLFKRNFNDALTDYNTTETGKSLTTKQFPRKSVKLPALGNFEYLTVYLKEECKKNLIEKSEPKWISSNVFVNKHFELGRMFGNMDTVKVAVYLMAKKLEELEINNKIKRYRLVSSSFNGYILANLIALIKIKKHICIPHLGPEIAVVDNRHMKIIKKDDKLVYIYDFIALGNEQKTVSIIAKLYNAEIVCSLGLTYYKPYKQDDGYKNETYSLIDFSEIKGDFYLAAEEKHVKNLMENNKNEKV